DEPEGRGRAHLEEHGPAEGEHGEGEAHRGDEEPGDGLAGQQARHHLAAAEGQARVVEVAEMEDEGGRDRDEPELEPHRARAVPVAEQVREVERSEDDPEVASEENERQPRYVVSENPKHGRTGEGATTVPGTTVGAAA